MTDRVREALFSSLGAAVTDAIVLDLFAGSGSIGLEALSRGAAQVTFVEKDRAALDVLRRNITAVGLGGTVVAGDVTRFLGKGRAGFDLVFVDPPYALPLPSLLGILERVAEALTAGGIAVVHRRVGEELPERVAEMTLIDQRRYGSAELWRFQKEET